MSDERMPLRVAVAAALGWADLRPARPFSEEEYVQAPGGPRLEAWYGRPDAGAAVAIVPLYDRDWSAIGPLIESMKINVAPPAPEAHQYTTDMMQWVARREENEDGTWKDGAFGHTPLVAVCNLILKLAAAGKLTWKVSC